SAPCSRTIRIARSRTSGEYRLGRAIGSILSTNGPSDKPGTVHVRNNGAASELLFGGKQVGTTALLRTYPR
ncbi:MAG: hypothetical protein LC775_05925, partial [Acidobacteria bacterium]|nr:hypothetical protein [Acidobacteriota bacterium]